MIIKNRIVMNEDSSNFVYKNAGDDFSNPIPVSLDSYHLEFIKGDGSTVDIYGVTLIEDDYLQKLMLPQLNNVVQLWKFSIFPKDKSKDPASAYVGVVKNGASYGLALLSPDFTPLNGDVPYMGMNFTAYVNIHERLMRFMASFKAEIMEYSERRIEHTKKKQTGKTRKNTITRIALYKYINDIKTGAKRLPHKKCDFRFGVRGHYRHYKSGKEVFVKAHERNKGKPERKPTIYKLPK